MTSRAVRPLVRNEPVEAVIVDPAAEGCQKRLLERLAFSRQIDCAAAGMGSSMSCRTTGEVSDPIAQHELVGPLRNHLEAEIFEKRHAAR